MSVTVYKSIKIEDAKLKTVTPINSTDKAKVNLVVGKFIQYLKAAHS
jgi:hypothetical protein